MAGGPQRLASQFTQLPFLAILEQVVKLAAIRLEFLFKIENRLEDALHAGDIEANGGFGRGEMSGLETSSASQVIGMDMGFSNPFHVKAAVLGKGSNSVIVSSAAAGNKQYEGYEAVLTSHRAKCATYEVRPLAGS